MPQATLWRRGLRLAAGLGAGAAAAVTTAAGAQTIPVKVAAPARDYIEVPVSVIVTADRLTKKRALPKGATVTPCQAEPAGPGKVRLTWIVRDLSRGQSRTYELLPTTATAKDTDSSGVVLRQSETGNVDFLVNGSLFTRYDTTTGPAKPYFYPVNSPTGKQIVRHWPMQEVEGETRDHPHHRGLWFTHGEMNGVDFWGEGKNTGKTVHTGYERTESGPVYGHLRAKTDWITPENKKIAEDVRDVTVYRLRDGFLMDFVIAIRAIGGPLHWGDTKEGTFALRVADSLRADVGKGKVAEGHIENARGETQGATWGKPAAWCDYYGPVDGETVGIAIFDHPQNLRHPTTWHVRTYGLFAVNPFGLHDFDPALKNNKTAGELITPEGQASTFRYRLFVHKGATKEARIPSVWAAYADPPRVEAL